ncbi:uncharacterized protein [Dermacentor andersoni]|uniref:uncharacterized protein isoform X3 n=1 Tax=Dermacentor andersoni TaxID=34620 RepID=UPI0024171C79|nr:uncharacterized protein LOC129381705 isoform X3 [Dermacentor andersoni]XP_054920741.1 uncharacterized protein LOC129381705 isoform X3 [Dermacentor andersoni]
MSGGSCNIAEGTSSAATDLDQSGVPEELREAAWHQRDNQAANRIQECRVCRFVFTNTETFRKHAADHSLGKNKNCPECGLRSRRRVSLTWQHAPGNWSSTSGSSVARHGGIGIGESGYSPWRSDFSGCHPGAKTCRVPSQKNLLSGSQLF